MIHKIGSPNSIIPKPGNQQEKAAENPEEFKSTLKGFLQDVNQMQGEAREATEAFLRGDITDIHQVTIATEKARVSLELLLEIRNKMMESYQEIMRMQV
ncbi:flagellar hook-basal body complex protein FliE [candidate division KSB1 bacterium 4484_188]|nr:MAG: flagellar hook-basal body complex protein FliE [candidate division KSB1 bacterium 4484_188]HFE65551.1 flagellar hook-basal body complex protein FliE [Caldithrix sp.]